MKFLAEIEHTTTTFRNQLFLTLKIDNRKSVDNLKQELKKTSTYSINMKDIEDDRTLKQNRLLWKLIGEINECMNDGRIAEDDEKIYRDALVESGACVEDFTGTPIDLMNETNKRTIRHAQLVEKHNNDTYTWIIYPGSSNFTKQEMKVLIEHLLDVATELDIDLWYWRDQFFGRETKKTSKEKTRI